MTYIRPTRWRLLALMLFVIAASVLPRPALAAARTDARAEQLQAGFWYTVQAGDTLYSIATRYGTTVNAIKQANQLYSNRIYVGQTLWIPGTSAPPPPPKPPAGGFWYTVQTGDTLYSIATRYGATPAAIMQANDLTNPNRIYVGQKLWIPSSQPGVNSPNVVGPDTPLYVVSGIGLNPLDPALIGTWTGLYFNNKLLQGPPAFTRLDQTVDFDWGAGSPNYMGIQLPADNFSAIWVTGSKFEGQIYRFYVVVDDGARLYIDNKLALNAWRNQSQSGYFVDVQMSAGFHIIQVDYYEDVGNASIRVFWRPL